MSEYFLVIWRDEEGPSTTIRTHNETIQLLEELAPYDIEWVRAADELNSHWFYDRMEDWPGKTGVIIKLEIMKPVAEKVVTKYSLRP